MVQCSICGSAVANPVKHTEFHKNLLILFCGPMGDEYQRVQVEAVERHIKYTAIGITDGP